MKKKLFLTILFFLAATSLVIAGPFLTTDPTDEPVTSYTLVLDGVETIEMPFTSQSGMVLMVKDLDALNLSNGVHAGTVQAWNTLWGIKTIAVPFEFTKPAQLTDPVIGLVGTDPRL